MSWNSLGNERIVMMKSCDQFAAYADAYLDSAERLCRILARSSRKATFERGVVVLFLASHAVELFLKSTIIRKAPEERFSHDLEHLKDRYEALYPAKRFKFHVPFHTSYESLAADQVRQAKVLTPKKDQLFRYPRDKNGELWHGLHAFEAGSFLLELVALRSNFKRLLREY